MKIDKIKHLYEESYYQTTIILFFVSFFILSVGMSLKRIYILDQSLAIFLIVMCASTSAFIASMDSFYKQNKLEKPFSRKTLPFISLTISLTLAFTAGIFSYLLSLLLPEAFHRLPYTNIGISFFIAGLMAMIFFLISDFVFRINAKKLALLLLTTFLSGFFISAVSSLDTTWWRWSICSLGMPTNPSKVFYNFTIIITGIMMLILGVFLTPELDNLVNNKIITARKSKLLKILYLIEASDIIMIGVIPYGVTTPLNYVHNFFAYYSFAHIGIIILFCRLLFKNFPQKFINLSYIIFACTAIYYFVNLYFKIFPAALAEIVVMVVAGIWIFLTVKTIQHLSEED